ncbi:hypothetical protein K0504_10135 [Neiella marina]|uniref:Uncharacterized protein n=1 Tax=Neiella holothuriorum TaxID=2870530 RepID=A0ABS7EGC7_9GAMM|nr:integrase repeat-containing protein [Neiella holothuriorum]MBW8191397.1 hypothetical protein [Neiella holothuriorum]
MSRSIEKCSFEQARRLVQLNGIASSRQYRAWENRPSELPADPAAYYSKTGDWSSWSEFTGSGHVSATQIGASYCGIEAATRYAHNIGASTVKAWREHIRSGSKPDNIPSCPDDVYRDQWTGWESFLAPKSNRFLEWPEALQAARDLGIRTQSEWRALGKDNKRPPFLPANPDKHYAQHWESWRHFLFA